MKYLLAAVLLLCFSGVFCQDLCAQYNSSCISCTNNPSCGWCTAVQTCMNGTIDGPVEGYCLGSTWQFGVGKCVKCESFTDCRECFAYGAECGWCKEQNLCANLTFFARKLGGCKRAQTCDCSKYKSCDQCLMGTDCQWCEGDEKCSSIDADCVNGPGFNKTVGCPCSANRDCFSCNEAFQCQWCNNLGLCGTQGSLNISSNQTCNVDLTQSCSDYCKTKGSASCTACNNLDGCGWCGVNNTCVDISSSMCPIMHSCENCESNKYCDPCLDNTNCMWCEQSAKCTSKKYGSCNGGSVALTCPNYCHAFDTCYSCNVKPGCGWCNSGHCLDVDQETCGGLYVHACDPDINPAVHCGFDAGAFVGGMFLVIGLIVLGILAFIVYRWKTGSRILYTELK